MQKRINSIKRMEVFSIRTEIMSLFPLGDRVQQFLNEEKIQLMAAPSINYSCASVYIEQNCIGFSFQSVELLNS